MTAACPFCEIAAGRAPATILWEGTDAMVIVPLDPVGPGHVLAIPYAHVSDWAESPVATGAATRAAIYYARQEGLGDCNLITSRGPMSTQSVYHLHLHIVPRFYRDGLALPWHSGKHKED